MELKNLYTTQHQQTVDLETKEFLEKEILDMKEIAIVEHLTLTVVKLIMAITTQLRSMKDQ